MADTRTSRTRSGSQKRNPSRRRVCYFDEAENARFEDAYAAWRGSVQATSYGESEGAFIRYMCIGAGARPLAKKPQRRLVLPSEILLAQLLAAHNKTGALLNQIARALNQNEMVHPQDLREALSAYRKTCGEISEALGLYL